MTEFDLFDAINDIDDDKITITYKRKIAPAVVSFSAIAACFALILFATMPRPTVDDTFDWDVKSEYSEKESKTETAENEYVQSDKAFYTPLPDVPADAHFLCNDAETSYSQEIMSLYEKISSAMQNKELPFVLTCGIYEKPFRVSVGINTRDAHLINKVKAYDSSGTLLEIKYVSNASSPQYLLDKD